MKLKVPSLFRKRYTEKAYQKKILKKIHISEDKKFLESLFSTITHKGKEFYTIQQEQVTDKKIANKLKVLAKSIKAQKGRFNVLAIAASFIIIVALMLVLVVFRNPVARYVLTTSLQGVFGAKVEIGTVDVNLLDSKFLLEDLSVANRNEPMKNLFQVSKIDLDFNILELSRGKIVAENLEVSGVSWNTERRESGSLPPAAEKKYTDKKKRENTEPNPVFQKFDEQLETLKAGISISSGMDSVVNSLDPVKILENELGTLQSPAIVEEISQKVPALTTKWEQTSTRTKETAAEVSKKAATITAIDPKSLKTVQAVQSTLVTVNEASGTLQKAATEAVSLQREMSTDISYVSSLSKQADTALRADSERLAQLSSSIKSVNLDSGMRLVSGIFDTFLINTLGNYYPLLNKGMGLIESSQTNKKTEQQTSLKKRANAVSRLPGRTIVFGTDSAPTLHIKRSAVSINDIHTGISGEVTCLDITNDQERTGKPFAFNVALRHGSMSEMLQGAIDLRSSAEKTVASSFTVTGYQVKLPSSGQKAVPSVTGMLTAIGTFNLAPEGEFQVESRLALQPVQLTVNSFEPAFLYREYQTSLSGISRLDMNAQATIDRNGKIVISVDSDIDRQLHRVVQDAANRQVAAVKKAVEKEAQNWITGQKATYSEQIGRFTTITQAGQKNIADIRKHESTADNKKAELDRRMKEIAEQQAAPVKEATDRAIKQAEKSIPNVKKLF